MRWISYDSSTPGMHRAASTFDFLRCICAGRASTHTCPKSSKPQQIESLNRDLNQQHLTQSGVKLERWKSIRPWIFR